MKWTDEDVARARKEGWAYQNGYVRQSFGPSPFYDPISVVEHLREKGKKSKWHRDVYLALPWTSADDGMSRHDGWVLYEHGMRACSTRFKNDEELQKHVQQQALARFPDPLCIKALARLAKRRLLEGVQI